MAPIGTFFHISVGIYKTKDMQTRQRYLRIATREDTHGYLGFEFGTIFIANEDTMYIQKWLF